MNVNRHHRRAAMLLTAVIILDLALGALFGHADHCGTWNGVYFAVVTVTTVGYGDLVPHGWAAHLVALAVMVLIIPMWSSVFAFVTAGITADHVDQRHGELMTGTAAQQAAVNAEVLAAIGELRAQLSLMLRAALPAAAIPAGDGSPDAAGGDGGETRAARRTPKRPPTGKK